MGQLQKVSPDTVERVRKWLESREKRLSKSRRVMEQDKNEHWQYFEGCTFDQAIDELLKEAGY